MFSHLPDNIHENQVAWYENEIVRMNTENKAISEEAGSVKSMAFSKSPQASPTVTISKFPYDFLYNS